MFLVLVRHGEAVSKEADPERPLAEHAWAEVRKVAAFIASQQDLSIGRILHSGKTRALQTAEAMSEFLKPPDGFEETGNLNPLDNPEIWAGRIKEMEEDVMLVGHLPFLNRLFCRLLDIDDDNPVLAFVPAAAACLERFESGKWFLHWMVVPQILP